MKNIVEKIKQSLKSSKESLRLQGLAVLASIALVILAILVSSLLYQPKQVVKRGYQIEIAADGSVVKKVEVLVDFASLMKTADANRGAKTFKKCATCHTIGKGEAAKIGPNLYGVLGRKRGSFPAFSYSEAMKAKGGAWDSDSINQFITKPKDYLPGTKMAFAGLKKPQDRADVILYLQNQK
jgi:cytochrome c